MQYLLDNQTTILYFISISAFLMSAYQTIKPLITDRVNLSFECYAIEEHERISTSIYRVMFVNNSSKPINILRLDMPDIVGNSHQCEIVHRMCGESYYTKYPETDLPISERKLSFDFPIYLPANTAVSGLVKFSNIPVEKLNTRARKINIVTNRKVITCKINNVDNLKTMNI